MGDLQDMRGFDPNGSLVMDQSIVMNNDRAGSMADAVPFNSD